MSSVYIRKDYQENNKYDFVLKIYIFDNIMERGLEYRIFRKGNWIVRIPIVWRKLWVKIYSMRRRKVLSLRKLNIGVCSLLGTLIMIGGTAQADENTETTAATITPVAKRVKRRRL